MKKYIAALLTALLLLCTALSAGAVGPALTTTEAYCIIDADTGLVLAQQNKIGRASCRERVLRLV